MKKVYVTPNLKRVLNNSFVFNTLKESPTLKELITLLQEIDASKHNYKVGFNSFDEELWISNGNEEDDVMVPLLGWN